MRRIRGFLFRPSCGRASFVKMARTIGAMHPMFDRTLRLSNPARGPHAFYLFLEGTRKTRLHCYQSVSINGRI